MSDFTLTESANKIIASDVRAFRADGKRYAAYIAEMGVTTETVAEHVAAFRNAFRAAYKSAESDEVKAYATKVRNGLNYHLGKADAKPSEPGVIRVSLSGEGGGTVTLRPGDEHYDFALTLMGQTVES